MGKELLLEIGTEEIPAAFMPKALNDMETMIADKFSSLCVRYGKIKTMGTPRRLFLHVGDVAEKQDDQVLERIGPAKRVAFDENGNPTKAAIGFARGQGIDTSEIETISTEKGKYICARKKIIGKKTIDLLPSLLPQLITSLSFRKSMRWMNLKLRFARPIHWILATFGGDIIPFNVENITSGNISYGHRFMSPQSFEVKDLDDYLEKTKKNFVIVNPEERKAIIVEGAQKAAAAVQGTIVENEDLLTEVTFIVEYPNVICGGFDVEYLELPQDVLVTSMTKHQKYFAIVDKNGNLLPHFITVTNTVPRNQSIVIRGNERVIRARLADARFFFQEDRKTPLDERIDVLKTVVFHSLLGTSYEKVMRFRKLAQFIADKINPAMKDTVDRAAYLCKTDLETQMVYEFPELQGIMGREYALLAGEDSAVAQAIYEHYLPISAGGSLPETDEGSIVSIADKMDTIVGCFGVNLIPTGTTDPYALRRQALGIINIILDKDYSLALDDLIDKSLDIFGERLTRTREETKSDVLDFFRARFENQLISQGYPYDVVDAVFAFGASDIVRIVKKINSTEEFKRHPDYEPLVTAFKRVVNIIKGFKDGSVDTSLFESQEEENLYEAFQKISEKANTYIDGDDYSKALSEIASLRKPVDDFFDTILVMAEDDRIRFNRLSLLKNISKLFYRIADFSKIVTE